MAGLIDYLSNQRPFDWQDNNCLKFVSGGLEAQGLQGLPSDWYCGFSGDRSAILHYRKTLKKYQKASIVEAFDDLFERVLTLHPTNGMIVARSNGDLLGYACGLVFMDQCYFLNEQGLVATPIQPTDYYWRVK